MKKIFCLLVTILSLTLSAQNISVASFELDPTDLTANLAGTTVLDQNGEKCALLRIQTTQTGFTFDVGSLGVQKTEQKTAEIWVYVPRGLRRITIRHQQLGTTEYTFPINIEPAKTYIMHLTTGKVETIVHNAVTSQYVLFNVNPSNAVVEFDGKMLETIDGTATIRADFGTYGYRIQAPRYAPEVGTIEVKDTKNKHIVTVSLEPQFATFTFNAPNNSEIWVNEQKRGVGSCTIELSYGTYMVETRLPNHRGVSQELKLNVGSNRTIQLKAPTPIYGALDINSAPANATVYWDEKSIGTTPIFLDNVLIGNHKLKLVKGGYKDYVENILIKENETTTITAKLEKGFSTDGKTFTVNGVSFEMIPVEGGTFTMGATSEQGSIAEKWEKPIHQVTLSNYSIGKTEVTQALWKAVMGNNPSKFKGDNLPVERVSWTDCQKFIEKLNQLTGLNFRLPTEAEWEFAARGGNKSKGYKYAGSNNLNEVAWYDSNSKGRTNPVGTKRPNELGIYDMSGNVWEWCQDWYGSYSSSSQTNPKGAKIGKFHLNRGGGWDYLDKDCRVSFRNFDPNHEDKCLGFRLCLSSEEDVVKNKEENSLELQFRTFTVNGVSFEMIPVEGGPFTMGAIPEQGTEYDNDEKPAHQVTLSSYSIGQTEVTQALWKAVMGSNPSYYKGDNLPVENVSWYDCQEFIKKLNQITGQNFRLPTEAEWEFAARGGKQSKGYKYAGSNNIDEVAWYYDNSNKKTHAVGTKRPNELGIYDMSGNVWEWCQDWKGSYSSSSQTNPKGPNDGSYRVDRGGSWLYDAGRCRVSYRNDYYPSSRNGDLGFRLCLP